MIKTARLRLRAPRLIHARRHCAELGLHIVAVVVPILRVVTLLHATAAVHAVPTLLHLLLAVGQNDAVVMLSMLEIIFREHGIAR